MPQPRNQSPRNKSMNKSMSDIIRFEDFNIFYGQTHAVRDVNVGFDEKSVTAIIGPSGCGKSSLIRSINRMNDLISGVRFTGKLFYEGVNIYDPKVDPVAVRRHIGMVFQQPNPYPTSVYDNVAWGLKINGVKDNLETRVEESLRRAAVWEEVKDRLHENALTLSGGQQQRLCIARAIALGPEVLLMDEPTSNLDPVTSAEIEELISDLKESYTTIIVSHDLNMAARVSDQVVFMTIDTNRCGYVEAHDSDINIFLRSENRRLVDYINRSQVTMEGIGEFAAVPAGVGGTDAGRRP